MPAKATLLEPIMSVEVVTPRTSRRRHRRPVVPLGQVGESESRGPDQVVHGTVPLSEMFGDADRPAFAYRGSSNTTMQLIV